MVQDTVGTLMSSGAEANFTEVTFLIQCTNTVRSSYTSFSFFDPVSWILCLGRLICNRRTAKVICYVLVIFKASKGLHGPWSHLA